MAKNKQQYGSSNVLVRVYEKSLLTPDEFERIIAAENVEEILEILSETAYAEHIENMTENNFEEMLTDALGATYKQIFKISPNQKLNEYIALKYTYHNMKVNFKEQITGNNLEHLYFTISPFTFSTIDYAVSSGESTKLPEAYLESIREAKEAYEEFGDLYSVDVIMDRRYHTHLRLLAGEIADNKLVEFTEKFIDYQNLVTLVRGMNQNRTRNFMNTVLSSSGSIPKVDVIDLGRGDLSDVIQFYSSTHLDKIVNQASREDRTDISIRHLEAIVDDKIMSQMHEGKRTASGPLPILAYIHAKETEVKNLRIILYAKELAMDVDEIQERMRLNYVT
jgi:V/A-type H+-transporting ATPase subunit C